MEPAGGETGRSRRARRPQVAQRSRVEERSSPELDPRTGRSTPAEPTSKRSSCGVGIRLIRDMRALATPAGVRGAMIETAWVAAHFAMYPLGVLRERPANAERYGYEHLTLRQRSLVIRNVEAASTPILLVHGMVDNRAIFTVLTPRLRAHGFARVVTLNYSPVTNDIRAAAEGLAVQVEALIARTGYERIHIVGHSLGGLIARYYVQRLGGDQRVHTLVTLGTPHARTLTARLPPVQLCRQLRPGSDLYAELAEPAERCRTRFVAYWSDLDQMILPHGNARLDHADLYVRNVRVHGVGHMSLPLDGQVVHEISAVFSQLDSDGTTLSAGVTPLLEETTVPRRRLPRPLSAS